ncbi:TonB family protein [Brevundimonas sp.]|uniref:TonB family protein n=1 Tax=Brevundimonas sp. TaxID=1871086 RepID=UPI0037BFE82C
MATPARKTRRNIDDRHQTMAVERRAPNGGKMRSWAVLGIFLVAACATAPTEGSAVVECDASPDGAVSNCILVSESHPGSGFGEQAVATVSRGTLKPSDGQQASRKFRTTVRGRM